MSPADMISVEEARERILAVVPRLEPESRYIEEALGQVLAEDVVAPHSLPPLDNTSMDGYAVKAADTTGADEAAPRTLKVVGEVAAGYLYDGTLQAGEAVRIMTGAPIPRGADAVVPFEETDETEGRNFGSFTKGRPEVRILKAAEPGANIRSAGEDVKKGDVILRAGAELNPAQIGVLASLGKKHISVYRRPVIAIVSTGDELASLDEDLAPGKIYDSNYYSIASMIREAGAQPLSLGIARDTVEDLTEKLHQGLGADMIVTSAGVSRGDYDVVKDVLLREGEVGFWTVCMRPGKPLAFGTFPGANGGRVPHIGLPGNPVSSMVAFELFGRAAIYKMMGRKGWERPEVEVTLAGRVVNGDERRVYARAIVRNTDTGLVATPAGNQSSGVLTSMSLANALIVCPDDVSLLQAGEKARALLIGPVEA